LSLLDELVWSIQLPKTSVHIHTLNQIHFVKGKITKT